MPAGRVFGLLIQKLHILNVCDFSFILVQFFVGSVGNLSRICRQIWLGGSGFVSRILEPGKMDATHTRYFFKMADKDYFNTINRTFVILIFEIPCVPLADHDLALALGKNPETALWKLRERNQ